MGADTKTMLLIFIFILSVSTVHAYTIAGYINDSSGDPVDGAGVALDGTTAQEAFDSVSIPTGTIYSGVVFTTSFYTFHSPNPDSFIGVTITQGLIDLIKQKVRGGSYWMKLNSIDITPNPYSVYYAYLSGQSEFKITAGSAMKEGSNTLQIYYTEYPSGALPSAPLPSMRAGVYYYPMHSTSMVSDESGYYSLSAPNGEYSISAGNEGYEPCSPNPISVVVSGADVAVDFCLAPINLPPTAYIDSISPSPAVVGEEVTFTGHGTDPDDSVLHIIGARSLVEFRCLDNLFCIQPNR
ncbi:MAG: hypothetical protein ACE5NL_00850 [Candidatus Hydrothermarchaeaceae archaeon]